MTDPSTPMANPLPPLSKLRPVAMGMDLASKSDLVSLNITINPVGIAEAAQSIVDLQTAVQSGLLSDSSVESIKALFDDAGVDIRHLATFRTDDLSIYLEPTEQYLGCVAAIAARDVERHVVCVEFRHGWPILSVSVASSTVAEGAAPASAAPEGCFSGWDAPK